MNKALRNTIDGLLILDKPQGISSFRAVSRVRGMLNAAKAGHAGTLDPIATGVLVVLLGTCTSLFQKFLEYDKEYYVHLMFGIKTATGDSDGAIVGEQPWTHVTEEAVRSVLPLFTGDVLQRPPMYSALHHEGQRLYKLARKGIEVPRKERPVRIPKITLEECSLPRATLKLTCSSGTYVRQLVEDIAQKLDTVAHMTALRRLRVGRYDVSRSVPLDSVKQDRVISQDEP